MPSKLGSLALEFVCCLFFVCMCFVNLRFVCCSRRHRRYLHRWSNNFKLEPLTWKAPFVFLLTPTNDWMLMANFCETLFLDLWAIVDAEHRQLDAVRAERLDVRVVDEADSVHVDHPQVRRRALQCPDYCLSYPIRRCMSFILRRLFWSSILLSRQLRNRAQLHSTTF